MKSISLKVKEPIIAETEQLLESLEISRNMYINEAIAFYNRFHRRKLLKDQLLRESAIVAEDSMEVLAEFEALQDEL